MGAEEVCAQTFVEWVLVLLEERFPWLGSGRDEPVGGADTAPRPVRVAAWATGQCSTREQ
jgi:hypothetical protein